MARFKKRARARSGGFARKIRHSKKSSGSKKLIQIDAMLYGAARPFISNLIAPLTSKIPFGDLADEAGMILVNYFAAKKMSGMIGSMATKGLIIENAMIGSSLGNRFMGTGSTASNNSLWTGGY